MAVIKLLDSCYTALGQMKKQIQEQKKKAGDKSKTSFSECVCRLLRETGRLPE